MDELEFWANQGYMHQTDFNHLKTNHKEIFLPDADKYFLEPV